MIKKQYFEEPPEKPTLPLEYQFAIFRMRRRSKKLLRLLEQIVTIQAIVTIILVLRWLVFK